MIDHGMRGKKIVFMWSILGHKVGRPTPISTMLIPQVYDDRVSGDKYRKLG